MVESKLLLLAHQGYANILAGQGLIGPTSYPSLLLDVAFQQKILQASEAFLKAPPPTPAAIVSLAELTITVGAVLCF